MHTHFMKHYGDYLKEHYSDLENMTMKDLCEAKTIAKTMDAIFKADQTYNIVKAMEEHDDGSNVELTMNEFLARARKMYHDASSPAEKLAIKTQLESIF